MRKLILLTALAMFAVAATGFVVPVAAKDKSTAVAKPGKLKIRGIVTRRDSDTFAARAQPKTPKPKPVPIKLEGIDGESMDKDHKGSRLTSPGILQPGGGLAGQGPAALGSSAGGGGSPSGGRGSSGLR
jgi:hypothetical protein